MKFTRLILKCHLRGFFGKAREGNVSESMRWHPVFIKWCLYLRYLLRWAYETLRESGCIHLPSQKTLQDYAHYILAKVGFSAEVDCYD